MQKLTTLQIIQRVLAATNDENVTSIDETESAAIVKSCLDMVYAKLIDDFPWLHLRNKGVLEVTTNANQMKLPDTYLSVDWIRYGGEDVTYITPMDMEDMLDGRDTTLANVDSNGAYTDKAPSYWTTFDDEYIIFDSYNSSLVSANSVVYGSVAPSELNVGSDVPDLPAKMFPLLMDGVLEEAFRILKGDEQGAAVYRSKYRTGLAKAKKWHRRMVGDSTTYGRDYGRRFTGNVSRFLTKTVIEA